MTILLVEPDTALADLLGFVLRREGYEVMTARDEAAATSRLRTKPPRLVITETALPAGSGWALCQALRTAGETPLLFLGSGAEEEAARALEAGGDAYLRKPLSPRLFQAQVQALLRRVLPLDGQRGDRQLLQAGDLVLDPQWRQVRRGQQCISLTGLEFKLLHELALHPGQVLPHQALVDRVWGFAALDGGAEPGLLKGHIRNLRRKLGEAGEQPRYIQTVAGVGYSFRPARPAAASYGTARAAAE
jgi:two-component system response regulator MtrA